MGNYKNVFQEFLRTQMYTYRSNHSFTQERMAEAIHVSPRSYLDQEHGKYGFSSLSFAFFLLLLPEEEVLVFLKDFRTMLERTEQRDVI